MKDGTSRCWFGGRDIGSRLLWKMEVESQKPFFRSIAIVLDPVSPPCVTVTLVVSYWSLGDRSYVR